jgi:protein-S-isoprenylcysteine O-methyltransferase Ste14
MNSANRQPSDVSAPGIIMRPPRLYLACLLLGVALDRVLPLPLDLPGTALMQWIASAGLILIGGAIFTAGTSSFSRAATPVPGNQPVRALVTTGIHGWSRNPIYVGMSFVYAGIGITARSPWVFILALPLAIVMRYVVVAREEAYLERCFGDAYRDYKEGVRRWL